MPEAGGPPGRPVAADQGDPFDLWLQRSLRQSFDSVASEPVPEDLLRMIEEDRAERDRLRQRRARR